MNTHNTHTHARAQEDFLVRLGARDLAANVEERTLVHLLLRADSVNRSKVDWRRLKVGGDGGARARASSGTTGSSRRCTWSSP